MSNRIKLCLIGEKYSAETDELTNLGIKVIKLKPSLSLDEEINCHADILAFNCDNQQLIVNPSSIGESTALLRDVNIVHYTDIKTPYPLDIGLNTAVVGNKIFCNVKYTSAHIIQWAKKAGKSIIDTKQGYCKCNMCILNDNAVITEDSGIASLLKNYQIDVLKIDPGYVYLSDKHYGFIGGASSKISNNELYFSGNIESHPQYNDIFNFLNKYSIKPIYAKNRRLNDFGGLVSIK